jgi:hypothetical protein
MSGHESPIQLPNPVFIGLCPKFRCPKPEYWCVGPETAHITEICSVSQCIAIGSPIPFDSSGLHLTHRYAPLYWATEQGVSDWLLPESEWGFSGSERPVNSQGPLYLYAYRAIPCAFTITGTPSYLHPSQLFAADYAKVVPEPDLSAYRRLGYDVVEFLPSLLLDFGGHRREENSRLWSGARYSPLSCNGLAGNYLVNQFCLFEDVEAAYRAGHDFGVEQPEPGSYLLVEVLRRTDLIPH